MLLVGIGPLGCIPSQLSINNSTGACVERINELVMAFNKRLVPVMLELNSTLPGSFFVYENTYDSFYDIIKNPSKYGELLHEPLRNHLLKIQIPYKYF